MLQLESLFPELDQLHATYGSKTLASIYGGGQITNPRVCLIFMNPTAKNVAAQPGWTGLRAPWIGTKKVWVMLHKLGLLKNADLVEKIQALAPREWDPRFAEQVYQEVATESLYVTNIAKCTQDDARSLPDSVFRAYRNSMLTELELINPKYIITFGNQVSSILLQKPVSVSNYLNDEGERLLVNSQLNFNIFPTYYPIGHGTMNMPKAISRIEQILKLG